MLARVQLTAYQAAQGPWHEHCCPDSACISKRSFSFLVLSMENAQEGEAR